MTTTSTTPAPTTAAITAPSGADHHLGAPSRRTVLAGITGATVVGWLTAERSWATTQSAPAAVAGAHAVPRLDGTLTMSPEAHPHRSGGNYSGDFGAMRTATPRAVLTPRSARDVAVMTAYARKHGLTIAMNGQSGENGLLESHSSFGQALTPGGIQVNSRGLSTIHSVSTTVADVDAGVTWAELVTAGEKVGARIPGLTDYIHLSIGGTISVGGIGGGVQRHGLQSDLVEWAEVVTGTGQVVKASRTSNRTLFDLVRAGAGQFGIVTRLGIRMLPAVSTVTVTTMMYADRAAFVADSETITGADVFEHQAGSLLPQEDGTWLYQIEVGSYYSPPETPSGGDLLATMHDERDQRTEETYPYHDWAFRVDDFAKAMVAGGYWDRQKPWLNLVVPAEKAHDFLDVVEKALGVRDFGAGFCIFAPLTSRTMASPMFALGPSSSGTHFFFDLLCFPGPDDVGGPDGLARNRRLYDAAVALGGKRYIIGAIEMTPTDWRAHFGTRYDALEKRRRQLDPAYVLTPGQGMFPAPTPEKSR